MISLKSNGFQGEVASITVLYFSDIIERREILEERRRDERKNINREMR
jgi:hypothetical protein